MNSIKSFIMVSLCFLFICVATTNAAQTHEFTVDEKGIHGNTTRRIYIGDTLRFINTGIKQHQIRSKSGLFFDSGLLNPGLSSEFTIKSEGSYVRSRGHRHLHIFDSEMPEHEIDFGLEAEPVILFPRDSWFIKKNPINILILFGNFISNPYQGYVPFIQVQHVKIAVDNTQIFSGSFIEFGELDYITIENTQGSPGAMGYNAFTLQVDPSTLSVGAHNLTVSVVLDDTSTHEDTVRYTILEQGAPIIFQ